MKKNPRDGGRYQISVKAAKKVANLIARECEACFDFPIGSVRICLTKMSKAKRKKLVAFGRVLGLPESDLYVPPPGRGIKKITHNGRTQSYSAWASELGLSVATFTYRYNKDPIRAFTTDWKTDGRIGPQPHLGRLLTFKGKTQNMAAWGRDLGISRERMRQRVRDYGVKQAILGARRFEAPQESRQ